MSTTRKKYDIYYDETKGHSVLGYDGFEETTGLHFLCCASPKEIDDEIYKRERVNLEYRFAFESLGIDRLDEISNLFKQSASLLDAASSGNEILVKKLLKAGADPNYQTTGGKTALMIASKYGYESHLGTVKLLVEAGAMDIEDENGLAALDYANESYSEETWKPFIAEYLLERFRKSFSDE